MDVNRKYPTFNQLRQMFAYSRPPALIRDESPYRY